MSTEVYTGVWTNWSYGRISGATLTLNSRDGGLLTAFLALFVTIVGSQSWRLSCYITHQLRSTSSLQDSGFYQRQVILRNSATAGTGAWAFLVQGFKGRKHNQRSILRTLPWLFVSTIFLVGFAVAAVLSSNISKSMSNARLLQGSLCGYWPVGLGDKDSILKISNDTVTAASYARSCYGGASKNAQCSNMPVQEITYTRNQNASCPFATGLCVYGNTAALSMSTRLIDSQIDLGINAPVQHRVQYQLTKTCAPINTTKYMVPYNATREDQNGMVGDLLFEYQFGSRHVTIGRDPNVTYVVGSHSQYGNSGYALTSFTSIATAAESVWTPIEALNRTDADVSIFFLEATTIRFVGTNNDPMFGAHLMSKDNSSGVFFSDKWATVMACAEQTRFCNPQNNICTPYLGSDQVLDYCVAHFSDMAFNTQQQAAVVRIAEAAHYLSLADSVSFRGSAALRITETLFGLIQPQVPDNQWMIEASSWFDTVLARFQFAILEYVLGPSNPAFATYYERPNSSTPLSAALDDSCSNQIIRDTSKTTSFSILGLAILLIFGGLMILFNHILEPMVGAIQKHSGYGEEKRQHWHDDDVMNLQSVVFDAKGGSGASGLLDYKLIPGKQEDSHRVNTEFIWPNTGSSSPYAQRNACHAF